MSYLGGSNYSRAGQGPAASSTAAYLLFQNPVTMRANPTFAFSGNIRVWNGSASETVTSFSIDNPDATTASVAATPGGTASGGNIGNFVGGNAGSVRISKSDLGYAASGGGAVAFEANDSTSKNSAAIDTTTNTANAGAKVSDYPGDYPFILNGYPASKSQAILVGSTITSFDGSNGAIETNTETGSPAYGAGSGGSCQRGTPASGTGGDGMVIIVYEI
jgi:hypothetical protein